MMRMAPVAMSCRRLPVRWRASFATRRSSAPLHNLLKILSPLQGWATAPYTFTTTDNTLPLPSWRTRIRHLLRPWDSPLSSLRVIARRNDEAIHLCQIYVRFVSQKTSISFPITYPTANDYSRLQTFNQRVGLDNWCFFATQSKKK